MAINNSFNNSINDEKNANEINSFNNLENNDLVDKLQILNLNKNTNELNEQSNILQEQINKVYKNQEKKEELVKEWKKTKKYVKISNVIFSVIVAGIIAASIALPLTIGLDNSIKLRGEELTKNSIDYIPTNAKASGNKKIDKVLFEYSLKYNYSHIFTASHIPSKEFIDSIDISYLSFGNLVTKIEGDNGDYYDRKLRRFLFYNIEINFIEELDLSIEINNSESYNKELDSLNVKAIVYKQNLKYSIDNNSDKKKGWFNFTLIPELAYYKDNDGSKVTIDIIESDKYKENYSLFVNKNWLTFN